MVEMGEFDAAGGPPPDSKSQTQESENTPFQAQLDHLSQSQPQPGANVGQYGQHVYDMAAMAGALPPNPNMNQRNPYAPGNIGQMLPIPNNYQAQQLAFQTQRGNPLPSQQQQQPFFPPQYGAAQGGVPNMTRQQPFPMQTQMSFAPMDPYGYGLSPASFSPIDPRFAGSPQFAMPGGLPPNMAQFARRSSSDSGPIPNYPRGPPRKPKQSGHALWVGNLPPAASITDLKDHFSREATNEIESVFLIAKSNCAFINYSTEAACTAAMNRFHDSRFHGVRLVCRLRRGTVSSSTTASPATPAVEESDESPSPAIEESSEEPSTPTIARSPSGQETPAIDGIASPQPGSDARVPEKYFIVKSLTAQDLEASVRNNIWATQSHNEDALNKAYETADNVYLIFSANKSGEYFGYARMASRISGEPVSLPSSAPAADGEYGGSGGIDSSPGSPQSIPTPATATAPRGRVIDDSARGTIFWEADREPATADGEVDGISPPRSSGAASASSGGQNWGKQFSIEWKSTSRLPFYRTRGLRNPCNANREVKIARDGTELEPSVGRRLVQMFHHRPSVGGAGAGGGSGSAPPPPQAQGGYR